jgi:hypothetical protein
MSAHRLSDWLGQCRFSPRRVAFNERNQHFLRPAYRALHDPGVLLDAQAETTDHRVSITKDVPILRIDHISTKSPLLGVWRGQRLKAVVGQFSDLALIIMAAPDESFAPPGNDSPTH